MRFRLPLVLLLAGTVVWWGCEEQMAPETAEIDSPAFAKGGPECDTKGAPVRDYFKLKDTQQTVDALLREFASACAGGEYELLVDKGFEILKWVELTRESPEDAGQPEDGADVVAVVWNIMKPHVCAEANDPDNCKAPTIGEGEDEIPVSSVAAALDLQGAFGVRTSSIDPVISYGNSSSSVLIPVPYWGIEPYASTWPLTVPGGRALILGYPDFGVNPGLPDEEPLGPKVAYDWTVLPWYSNTDLAEPLSVTVCASADAGYKEKIAHGATILPDGQDSWCGTFDPETEDPLLASSGLKAGIQSLARAVIPFWPQELNATALGVSGSGKAREFSPYFGHQLDPEGLVFFITVPGDATAYDPGSGDPAGTSLICASSLEEIDAEATECPDGYGIRVHLTTSNESWLSGDESVLMAITAEDNNGSWTLYGLKRGEKVEAPGYGLVYEWNSLALDKPGAYKLHTYRIDAFGCVLDDDGNQVDDWGPCNAANNSVGLAFPAASSEKFIVNP